MKRARERPGELGRRVEQSEILHEDEPERLPGPELGDYLGIPINATDRLRGDSGDASA